MSFRTTFITSPIYCRNCRIILEDQFPKETEYATISVFMEGADKAPWYLHGMIKSHMYWGAEDALEYLKKEIGKFGLCSEITISSDEGNIKIIPQGEEF